MMGLDAALSSTGGAPPQPEPPGRPGIPVEPRRIIAAIVGARLVLAVATAAGGVAGLGAAKTLGRSEYESTAVLAWQPGGKTPPSEQELQTLIESVLLPANIAAVRTELDLPMTLEQLAAVIEVRGSKKSRLITIRAQADGPEAAARIANGVAKTFIDRRREALRDDLMTRAHDLGDAKQQAQRAVDAARTAYDAFRSLHGITSLDAERQATLERLSRVGAESELSGANADAEAARARSLARAAEELPQRMVRQETETRPVELKLAEARTELVRLRARLSEDHPRVQALAAEIEALRANAGQLPEAETARTVAVNPRWEAVSSDLTNAEALRAAASTRRETLGEMARAARRRLEQLAAIEGEDRALAETLKAEEAHLSRLSADHAEALDAARNPDPSLRVVSSALASPLPVRSTRRKIAVIGPATAFVFALTFVLARAVWRLRLYAPSEIAFWSRVPVVAASTWPATTRGGRALAEDLAFRLRTAPGTTLVLPLGDAERKTLSRLARRIVRSSEPVDPERVWFVTQDDDSVLRRKLRSVDRVLVVAASGCHTCLDLAKLTARLDREDRIAMVVVGVGPDVAACARRVGASDGFWSRASAKTERVAT